MNHVRTLLLNMDGPASRPDDEYRDPAFRAVPLPDHLAAAHAVLYGAKPDVRMRLYRVRQFMAVLHSTRLAAYVTAVDPRITYLPLARGGREFPVGLTTTDVGGHGRPVHVAGDPPVEAGGRSYYAWSVAATTGGLVVAVEGGAAATTPLDFSGGWSAPLPLAGSRLTVSVPPGLPSGTSWRIEYAAAPSRDLGDVAASLDRIGADRLRALFGDALTGDRADWRSYWAAESLPLPYRLGAFLLAVAAGTDDARAGT